MWHRQYCVSDHLYCKRSFCLFFSFSLCRSLQWLYIEGAWMHGISLCTSDVLSVCVFAVSWTVFANRKYTHTHARGAQWLFFLFSFLLTGFWNVNHFNHIIYLFYSVFLVLCVLMQSGIIFSPSLSSVLPPHWQFSACACVCACGWLGFRIFTIAAVAPN